MRIREKLSYIGILLLMASCSVSKSPNKNLSQNLIAKPGSSQKGDSNSINKIRPYKEIITEKAITDSGLFIIHKIASSYYFEIPNSLIGSDLLIVSRIAKGSSSHKPVFGYAGDEINENVIQFSKSPHNNKLFIRQISYDNRSEDSSVNGMYKSVSNSNLQPIISSFDIKAFGSDSSIIIDASDWINDDNNLLYFNQIGKNIMGISGFQKDKSFTEEVQAFSKNVELQELATYKVGEQNATFELNASIVLLPKEPMRPRYYDERIGYFGINYLDFDSPKGVQVATIITRWRLEPKPEDQEKYLKGELVEPAKPIVYYIDPSVPKKWVSYIIQGVTDWQRAFEKAGFKNAIYALEAPKNDKEWSLLDARHSAIIYKPSSEENASGPHIHDPRTGEILETHVNLYHNVIQLLHDWYMVQAGPNDSGARKMEFDDDLMGKLIRFVVSHEVGHTLGLAHNYGASSAVPVDSLRSKTYINNNGICPSIMDYARFNYVAQPEDGLKEKQLMPRIGVYDEWAINWGYRWLPQLKTKQEEKSFMDEWVTKTIKNDKRLFFGKEQDFRAVRDPRCQPEDLGDDAMKAGYYGIENLKRVMTHIMEWSTEAGGDFSSLQRMNQEVINQYSRYIVHVINNVGKYTWTPSTFLQRDSALGFITKKKQKEAIQFLQEQLFQTPSWLMNSNITYHIGGSGTNLPGELQARVLNYLFSGSNQDTPSYLYGRMSLINEIAPKEKNYPYDELLGDLEDGIFKELKLGKSIDYCRRRLQKIYVEKLVEMNGLSLSTDPEQMFTHTTDFYSIVQLHMKQIVNKANAALRLCKDIDTKNHLLEIKHRLLISLNPNTFSNNKGNNNDLLTPKNSLNEWHFIRNEKNSEELENACKNSCWYSVNPF